MSFREVVIVKKQDNKWQMLFEFFPVEWRPKYDRYYINCDLTKTNLICLYYYQKDTFKDQYITNILLEEIHDAQYFDNIDIAGFLIDNELTLAGNQGKLIFINKKKVLPFSSTLRPNRLKKHKK